MGLNNRATVKECNQLPFLVTFLNLALIYCHIPFNITMISSIIRKNHTISVFVHHVLEVAANHEIH